MLHIGEIPMINPVIYVRHNAPGSEFEPGKDEWQIFEAISPLEDEPIIDKFYTSAFHKTQLDSLLKSLDVSGIISVGMQVEYCVDTTIRSAFDLGYQVYLPKDGQSTYGMVVSAKWFRLMKQSHY